MVCQLVKIGETTAFVCGPRRPRRRCACGQEATKLCDWKVPGKRSGTCDKPICREHALSVGPDKDLCPEHQAAYERWLAERGQ